MDKKVALYCDEGVSASALEHLRKSLLREGVQNIRLVSRLDLKKDNWKKDTFLLIVPGGRDVPYHKALKGEPNKNIRSFVEEGGRYLGLCAGAYYGSAGIEFEKGTALEIVESRELCFFPGVARGPAYGNHQFCYRSSRGARVAHLLLADSVSAAFFNGGPAFI
ncbi:MAG: BPL-N domain-containing protein, partial [Chlamydiota bacterium]